MAELYTVLIFQVDCVLPRDQILVESGRQNENAGKLKLLYVPVDKVLRCCDQLIVPSVWGRCYAHSRRSLLELGLS